MAIILVQNNGILVSKWPLIGVARAAVARQNVLHAKASQAALLFYLLTSDAWYRFDLALCFNG